MPFAPQPAAHPYAGSIGKDHVDALIPEQPYIVIAVPGIAAYELVPSQYPDVAHVRYSWASNIGHSIFCGIGRIGIRLTRFIKHKINLGQAKTGKLNIKVEIDQTLKLYRQYLAVPARIEGKLVVREHIRPLFGFT